VSTRPGLQADFVSSVCMLSGRSGWRVRASRRAGQVPPGTVQGAGSGLLRANTAPSMLARTSTVVNLGGRQPTRGEPERGPMASR
jgi:hypothetical protein